MRRLSVALLRRGEKLLENCGIIAALILLYTRWKSARAGTGHKP